MTGRDRLRDPPAHRVTDDVRVGESQVIEETERVVDHHVDGVRRGR